MTKVQSAHYERCCKALEKLLQHNHDIEKSYKLMSTILGKKML